MLEQLRQALEMTDAAALVAGLAEDVTLRVAVHDEPYEGVAAAAHILGVVLDGVLRDVEVLESIEGGAETAVLMFRARVAQHIGRADGLLVVRSGASGRISDLNVYLRPLAALQALDDEMGRRLGGPRPGAGA